MLAKLIKIKCTTIACFTSLSILSPALLCANPTHAHSIKGDVSFSNPTSNTLEVTASDRSIINWGSFSIGQGEVTQFIQPNANAAVLNRVTGTNLSEIHGKLISNGRIYLVNQNGVMIGNQGLIQTAGFIASTLDVSNDQFLKGGELNFKGDSHAKVINLGKVESAQGDIFLIAFQTENHGDIEATRGSVGLAAASDVLIKPAGKERLFIRTQQVIDHEEKEDVGILQSGNIQAMRAELKADGNAYRYGIRHDGVIEACGMVKQDGIVYLVAEDGILESEGTIVAKNDYDVGGEVRIFGKRIHLLDASHIDASGDLGGGSVLIGGALQGIDSPEKNATHTFIGKEALIDVNALTYGNGGTVIVWSDESTGFYGNIRGEGGARGGHGGFVEVSGANFLDYKGLAHLLAPYGRTGTLLLDPTDVTISGNQTSSGAIPVTQSDGAITYSYSNLDQVNLEVHEIIVQLLSANMLISTVNPEGNGNGDITVDAPIMMMTGNSLGLTAERDINVNALIGGDSSRSDITLTAQRDINVKANVCSNMSTRQNPSTVSLNAITGDICIEADVSPVKVGSRHGTTCVKAPCGNIKIIGGSEVGAYAVIGNHDGDSSGVITVEAGKDLIVEGGSGCMAYAAITRLGAKANASCISGNINVRVGENLTMCGGNEVLAQAFIGHGGFESGSMGGKITGDIHVNVGNDMEIKGGSDAKTFIGTASLLDVMSDIHVCVGKNVLMHNEITCAGQGAYIGAENCTTAATQQNLFMTVGCNMTMDARDAGPVTLQPIGENAELHLNVGGDLAMISGSTPASHATIFLFSPQMTTKVNVLGNIRSYNGVLADSTFPIPAGTNRDLGSVNIRSGGNLILGGGNHTTGTIITNSFTSSGSICLAADGSFSESALWNARDVEIKGSNIFEGTPLATNSPQQLCNGKGGFALDTARYNAKIDIYPATLSGFVSANNPYPPFVPAICAAANPICYSSGDKLYILSAPLFANCTDATDLNIGDSANHIQPSAKGDLIIGSLGNMSDLRCGGFRDISIAPVSHKESPISNCGDILMVANRNITIKPNACIESVKGRVDLVVDNSFPDSPDIGPGAIFMDASAKIEGPQGVCLYTARQPLNAISGLINSQTFSPQIRFVDNNHELYHTYFLNPVTKPSNFVVLYKEKDGIVPPPPVPPSMMLFNASDANFELFVHLHGYQEYTGWEKTFNTQYDHDKYKEQIAGQPGYASSFDKLLKEKYHIRKTKLLQSDEKNPIGKRNTY